ncbi:unnamed protein product, partial [Prunus brigantina]
LSLSLSLYLYFSKTETFSLYRPSKRSLLIKIGKRNLIVNKSSILM